ncbi:MAG: flippase [candidate division WOR-3 bacterium]|nr:flippase [candidate division WOR-3 bacterium]
MRGPVRNAGFLFAGEAASRVFGFLTTAVLARRLGVDGFGQIGFAAAVMAYGVVFTDLGLTTVGTRSVARDRSQAGGLVGSVVPLRLLLSLVAAAAIVLIALVLPKPAPVKWLLVLYAGAVIVQSVIFEWVFIGAEQMGFVSLSRIVTNSGYFVLVLFLVRSPGCLLLVPVAFGIATAMGALVLLVAYAPRFGPPPPRFRLTGWRELLRSAGPIGAASLLTQLHVNLGLILLGLTATFQQTGIYNSAYRLVFFLMTLDRVFYTVFFPVVSRFLKDQPTRLAELVGTAMRMILALSVPFCVGAFILARPILGLVFSTGYVGAFPVLRILVWFLPLSMFNSLAGYTLLAAGNERLFLRNTAIGVGAAVVFNLVAIPLAGSTGAALAIVAGEAGLLVLMGRSLLAMVRPKLELRTVAPLVAAAAMAVVVYLLRGMNVFGCVGFGALTYSVFLLLLRGVTADDIGLARNG